MAPSADNALRPFERPMPLHSAESFSELFNQTDLIVFRYIYGLHGSPQEAVEDLTAETYLRAWRGRARFAGDEQAALRWLLRIARNLVIDSYRREPRSGPRLRKCDCPISHQKKQAPEDQVLIAEQIQLLLKALTRLPAQQREMVVLRFVLGWRVKDIAEHLGLVQNTVSVNLQRTLRRLRQNWPAGYSASDDHRNELNFFRKWKAAMDITKRSSRIPIRVLISPNAVFSLTLEEAAAQAGSPVHGRWRTSISPSPRRSLFAREPGGRPRLSHKSSNQIVRLTQQWVGEVGASRVLGPAQKWKLYE